MGHLRQGTATRSTAHIYIYAARIEQRLKVYHDGKGLFQKGFTRGISDHEDISLSKEYFFKQSGNPSEHIDLIKFLFFKSGL